MTALTYARYDLLRVVRNRRFFIFSLGIPLVLYLLIAGENRHAHASGLPFPTYYLAGMVSFGTMNAVIAGGGIIALERAVGWTRQLRITPLPVWAYMLSKVVRGYAMACTSIIVLYIAGLSLGVHFSVGGWLLMTGLILIGLLPFSVLGIVCGHLLSPDSLGPAMGGIIVLFSLLGGSFGQLATSGALHDIAQVLPSYWLVQAAHAGLTLDAWPTEGWIVVAVWTAALVRLAMIVYQRDTGKT
ncbi:MAG TPA: ABC transporter permease [Acidimicrobiales bacterium]|nr:ABC transporter permease [Acidimicrobiales bacterium]